MTAATSFLAGLALAAAGILGMVVDTGMDSRIASISEAEVCATDRLPGSAYSRAHRVVRRRSVPGHQVDHIVPLCLGGADNDPNVQVQPIEEAAAKDQLEVWACIAVCRDHRVPLAEAQSWFLGDWRIKHREIFGR